MFPDLLKRAAGFDSAPTVDYVPRSLGSMPGTPAPQLTPAYPDQPKVDRAARKLVSVPSIARRLGLTGSPEVVVATAAKDPKVLAHLEAVKPGSRRALLDLAARIAPHAEAEAARLEAAGLGARVGRPSGLPAAGAAVGAYEASLGAPKPPAPLPAAAKSPAGFFDVRSVDPPPAAPKPPPAVKHNPFFGRAALLAGVPLAGYAAYRALRPGAEKKADLKPEVTLQPHQKRIAELAEDHPLRVLLVHALGSGKSLSGLAAAEAAGGPYTTVAPASLRQNYKKEIAKFTDGKTPSDVLSYTELAAGKPVPKADTVVFDEAHNLRNPESGRTRRAVELADRARQVVMLSGTPVVNRPGDLATPLRMLTGRAMTPDDFEARYVGSKPVYPNLLRRLVGWSSGREPGVSREEELKGLLRGHVDWHDPGKPVVPTTYEDVPVEMGPEQVRLHDAMWDKLPWWAKWKLKNDVDVTDDDLRRLTSFLTGPRQIGLSDYPFAKDKDPLKSFDRSAKLTAAMARLKASLADDRAKALVFSNFIDAGLSPYAAALAREGIPHGVFHGGLSDEGRRKLVEDYNAGRSRVALLGPSGTEGLSFKGTQLVQLLDPYWNPVRPRQSVGRGLRFDSHADLPPELRNVKVERFLARLPKSTLDRIMEGVGFDRTDRTHATDDRLARISARKERLNQRFVDLLREVGTEGH